MQNYREQMIYTPPLTTLEIVELEFPWSGKIYKIKKIPYKSKIREENDNDTPQYKIECGELP